MNHETNLAARIVSKYAFAWVLLSFVFAGWIDYVTGNEIRSYPLYFLPLSLASWRFGKTGGAVSVATATVIWVLANWTAGLRYSSDLVWVINSASQAAAFGTVAVLLCWARYLLEQEREMARTDNLTGLANARAFHLALSQAAALCRRNKRPLTLAYIDLDNFKCVNDRYGHSRGDQLLVDVAAILKSTIRQTDHVARMGGDEFVVCLPETTADQAQLLLERLRLKLASVFPDGHCRVSASIGASCWNIPPVSLDDMISAADQTMYAVKKAGKNRLEIVTLQSSYPPEQDAPLPTPP